MGLAISKARFGVNPLRECFNSLFVGMGLAIINVGNSVHTGEEVSIPFSSGWALQYATLLFDLGITYYVSIPFSSGWALQSGLAASPIPAFRSFNSLFVGMGLAISPGYVHSLIDDSFNSLFVGMGLAMMRAVQHELAEHTVSIPFSSGWALQ